MPFGLRQFGQRRPEEEDDETMLASLMDQYGQPDEMQTPVFDQYLEEMQNVPQREDYQIGTGKKILAGLAGGLTGFTSGARAGQKVIEDIQEAPYRRAQEDFKNRIEPLEKGVGFEKAFGETLRKSINDQRGFGAKLAKIEADYTKAKGQLDVAERNATTKKELARIAAARQDLDAEYKRGRLKVDRMNAGSNRMRAGAAQTSAGARMKNAEAYSTGGSPGSRHVKPKDQMDANKLVFKQALDDSLAEMPFVRDAGGVHLDKNGDFVFPKDMDPRIQDMFKKIHRKKMDELASKALSKTY